MKTKSDLLWNWTDPIDDRHPWEKECEEDYQKFRLKNSDIIEKLVYSAMIYKLAYFACYKRYRKAHK